jgi:hypothetical protein
LKFIPAKSKLEAVARISTLTNSGPEELGPGSKERKSVLTNLARGLKLSHLSTGTKQEIASALARHLNITWTSICESKGQTITLHGLNLLLEASEKILGKQQNVSLLEMSLNKEIELISKVVLNMTPKRMDGYDAVHEMKNAEYSKWRETEWQGFYFEFKVRPALINALGGGPVKIANTEFDYQLSRVWDMKTHSSVNINGGTSRQICPLNDSLSIDAVTKQFGFGLIILSGIPIYDMEFSRWHKNFRSGKLNEPRKQLKKSFTPTQIDFFYIPDANSLEKAKSLGLIKIFKQGKQQSGAKRAEKYSLDLKKSENTNIHMLQTKIT